jgi:hypothetical protein
MVDERAMLLAGLALAAGFLAALLAQPLRGLAWHGWRALMLLLAPFAVLGQVAAIGMLAERALLMPLAAVVLLAVLALLAFPLALLAAMLLVQPEPAGLRAALAGIGVSPAMFYRRVTLPALLPGFLLGWAVSALSGLAALAWAVPHLVRP